MSLHNHGRVIIVFVLAMTGFIALSDAVSEHNGLTSADPHIAHDVLAHRSDTVTAMAHVLTFIGSEPVVGAAMLALVAWLIARRRFQEAVVVAIGIAGSAAMTVGIKLAVERSRPPTLDRLGAVDHSFSFPSGHTLNSAVALGLIVLVVAPRLPHRSGRTTLTFFAALTAFGIGASRVYLGYHWATDVLASWLLAIAWLMVLRIALDCLLHHDVEPMQSGHNQVRGLSVDT